METAEEASIIDLKLEILLKRLRVVNYDLNQLEINRLRRLIEIDKVQISIPKDYLI